MNTSLSICYKLLEKLFIFTINIPAKFEITQGFIFRGKSPARTTGAYFQRLFLEFTVIDIMYKVWDSSSATLHQWWKDLFRCRIDLLNFSMGFNIIAPYMEFLHLNWYIDILLNDLLRAPEFVIHLHRFVMKLPQWQKIFHGTLPCFIRTIKDNE